jgi:serine/threonine-protein kinase
VGAGVPQRQEQHAENLVKHAVNVQEKTQQLGRYELLSELGQGAMGVVYKARDPVLDRVVAIKTINLTLPKDELSEYEARFYQEARAAGGLNHPNIVTIYDIGKSDRVAYMAMEFLEGEELRSVLSHREPLPVALALDIAAQVAEGLDYAHESHIVHRDIKPANIMIVRDGLVKITDFGIARMRTNEVKTMTGMILGSPKYMSPEQVAGKRADHRADLFSLGVVLYEMLTGAAPFLADSIHGIMYQILHFTPPAPSTRNAELPEMVDLIVTKALAKSAEERYQSARDFAEDLKSCRDMLAGKQSVPAGLREAGPGEPAATAATRRQDRLDAVKAAPPGNGEADSGKGLALAKSFDSYEATLRLASLTGQQADAAARTQTTAKQAGDAAGATDTWQEPKHAKPAAAGAHAAQSRSYAALWILSAIALAAAAAIYLLR